MPPGKAEDEVLLSETGKVAANFSAKLVFDNRDKRKKVKVTRIIRKKRPGHLDLPCDVWFEIGQFLTQGDVASVTSSCKVAKTLLRGYIFHGRCKINNKTLQFMDSRKTRIGKNFTIESPYYNEVEHVCFVDDLEGNNLICAVFGTNVNEAKVFCSKSCEEISKFKISKPAKFVHSIQPLTSGRIAFAHDISRNVCVSVFHVSKNFRSDQKHGKYRPAQRLKFDKEIRYVYDMCILGGIGQYSKHLMTSCDEGYLHIFDVDSDVSNITLVHKLDMYALRGRDFHVDRTEFDILRLAALEGGSIGMIIQRGILDVEAEVLIYDVDEGRTLHIVQGLDEDYCRETGTLCSLQGGGCMFLDGNMDGRDDLVYYIPEDGDDFLQQRVSLPVLRVKNNEVHCFTQLKDGRVVVGTAEGYVLVYDDLFDGSEYYRKLELSYDTILSLRTSPDGLGFISSGGDGNIIVTTLDDEYTDYADDASESSSYSSEESSFLDSDLGSDYEESEEESEESEYEGSDLSLYLV